MSDDVKRLTEREARTLTNKVKANSTALWTRLLELYERRAHIALNYSSWAAYCAVEFDYSKAHAYRLLAAARVVELLAWDEREAAASPQSGDSPPDPPQREAVARELIRLKDDPENLRRVWTQAAEIAKGGQPTAEQVRRIVDAALGVQVHPQREQAAGNRDGEQATVIALRGELSRDPVPGMADPVTVAAEQLEQALRTMSKGAHDVRALGEMMPVLSLAAIVKELPPVRVQGLLRDILAGYNLVAVAFWPQQPMPREWVPYVGGVQTRIETNPESADIIDAPEDEHGQAA